MRWRMSLMPSIMIVISQAVNNSIGAFFGEKSQM